jgi:V/A-type H+/Na+-transporting ATPase subunit E
MTVGTAELLAALRSEGERKAGLIREQADADAARLRAEAEAGLCRLREEARREQERAGAAAGAAILAQAEREARLLRLAAQERLAERLHGVARRLTCRLRGDDYPAVFARLAAELPPVPWEEVRVNPADAELAATLFPGARIAPDDAICGGLVASAEGGRMEVINTLETRLERGWPELLPTLLEEVEHHA